MILEVCTYVHVRGPNTQAGFPGKSPAGFAGTPAKETLNLQLPALSSPGDGHPVTSDKRSHLRAKYLPVWGDRCASTPRGSMRRRRPESWPL